MHSIITDDVKSTYFMTIMFVRLSGGIRGLNYTGQKTPKGIVYF